MSMFVARGDINLAGVADMVENERDQVKDGVDART